MKQFLQGYLKRYWQKSTKILQKQPQELKRQWFSEYNLTKQFISVLFCAQIGMLQSHKCSRELRLLKHRTNYPFYDNYKQNHIIQLQQIKLSNPMSLSNNSSHKSKIKSFSYSRYTSYYKNNFLLHRLSNDSGYPEEFHHPTQNHPTKNFLTLNKKNLRNFFKDRIPTEQLVIQGKVQMLSPSKITKIKKQQLKLKDQTRSRINYSIKTYSKDNYKQETSLDKMNSAFQIQDKNKEVRENFNSIKNKKSIRYDLSSHRFGTTSFINKKTKLIKKQAYENVFGTDMSLISRTCEVKQIVNKSKLIQDKIKQSMYIKNKMIEKESKSKQFKVLITKMLEYEEQKHFVKNSQSLESQITNNKKQDDEVKMIEWIKNSILSQKEKLYQTNYQIKTLEDLKKLDSKFYKEMTNHKKRRLEVRKMNISSKYSNQFVNTPLCSIQSQLDKNQSVYSNQTQKTKENPYYFYQTKKQRFKNFCEQLLILTYKSQIYGIAKKNIYSAFWHPSEPYEKAGSYLFFKAIKNGDLQIIQNFVNGDQIYLFEKDQRYFSPLMIAVKNNRFQVAEYIINKGVNIDYQAKNKKKALFYALENNNIQICSLLLKAGASPYSQNYCNYKKILKNQKMITLFKNARKIWVATILLKKSQRLKFWNDNKHKINHQSVLMFDN